jgi:predicted O-methyltransferase YrrM
MKRIIAGIKRMVKRRRNHMRASLYSKYGHDRVTTSNQEMVKFESWGLDYEKAVQMLNTVLSDQDNRYNADRDSIHWALFSALSEKKSFKKILEIGTYEGEFTHILGKLFPKSKIVTVDLPDHDPIVESTYNRANSDILKSYVEKQDRNTEGENIRTMKTNTLFLLDALSSGEKFDLIWIDGGHLYPDVAWDICNAYHLLEEDGMMLCDDIIPSKKPYNNGYVSTESYEVLNYLEERIASTVTYFLKRTDPYLYALEHTRKYVALMQKK